MAEFEYRSNSNVFPEVITTERLEFRPLCYKNISIREYYELMATVTNETEYTTTDPFESVKDADDHISDAIDKFDAGEGADYLMFTQDQREIIGTTSFHPDWDASIAESGILVFEEYWGEGYATERGEMLLELAFTQYNFDYWISKCVPENTASRELMRKYVVENGGQEVGVLPNQVELNDGEYTDLVYFTLDRDAYLTE